MMTPLSAPLSLATLGNLRRKNLHELDENTARNCLVQQRLEGWLGDVLDALNMSILTKIITHALNPEDYVPRVGLGQHTMCTAVSSALLPFTQLVISCRQIRNYGFEFLYFFLQCMEFIFDPCPQQCSVSKVNRLTMIIANLADTNNPIAALTS